MQVLTWENTLKLETILFVIKNLIYLCMTLLTHTIKNNINIDDGMIKDRLTLKKNLLKHADNYINAGGNLKDGNLLIEDQTWKDALSLWQDLDQNSNLYKMWKSITTKERQKRLVEENLFYYRGFIGMSFR